MNLSEHHPAQTQADRLLQYGAALCAALVVFAIFLPTLGYDFVAYDDPDYVLNNPLIRNLDVSMVSAAFSGPHVGWWMPLTWISLAVDFHFWGLEPRGYHLTNVLLHSLNTGLVAVLAGQVLRLTGGESVDGGKNLWLRAAAPLLAGLLWGIHPLRVESVAWVTERKDVLNGLCTLGALLAYLRYAALRKTPGRNALPAYCAALGLFACSLMAKSISVVLPVMLLLLDRWPLERLNRSTLTPLVMEKIPFLFLSLAMSLATTRFASQAGYMVSYDAFPFSQRLLVSGHAVFEYCRLLLVPFNVLPFYLIPDPIPGLYALTSCAVVAALGLALYLGRGTRWVPVLLGLSLLPLAPVLAFFQNGDQALAARFTYLPTLAPSIAVAIAFAHLWQSRQGRSVMPVGCSIAAVVLVLLFGGVTVRDSGVWRDSISMWSRVIEVRPEVASYKERGRLHAARGDYRSAVADFTAAIGLADGVWRQKIYNLYAFRGEAYRLAGRYTEAVQDFTAAIELFPHPVYFARRSMILGQLGDVTAAERDRFRAGDAPGELEWFERGALP